MVERTKLANLIGALNKIIWRTKLSGAYAENDQVISSPMYNQQKEIFTEAFTYDDLLLYKRIAQFVLRRSHDDVAQMDPKLLRSMVG